MLSEPLGGSLFNRKPFMYLFLPSYEEAEESFSMNYSQEPGTPAEAHSPSSSSVPPADA